MTVQINTGFKKGIICSVICLIGFASGFARDSAMGDVVPVGVESEAMNDTLGTDNGAMRNRMPYYSAKGEWNRLFRLKTNAAGWLLMIANLEGEIDMAEYWSFDMGLYFSAMNYFTSTMKFRLFGVRPEFRRWFRPENTGWFVGAHFGIGGFNFAFGGEYRYQSDWRRRPAVGGGLTAGYRMPISKDRRWEMEFALGLGVYSAPYNRFENKPNSKPLDVNNKIYVGPDLISVSFSYAFDAYNKQKRVDRAKKILLENDIRQLSGKGGAK